MIGAATLGLIAVIAWLSVEGLDRDLPRTRTLTRLRVLSQALEAACESPSGCPASYDEMVAALDMTGLNSIQRRELLADQWGRAIRPRETLEAERRHVILYSVGLNAIDEGGEGDDIVVVLESSEN